MYLESKENSGNSFRYLLSEVQNSLSFRKIPSNEKKNIYIESFEIKIDNEKDIYEIGDVINYDVSILPQKANVTALLYKIDNEISELKHTNSEPQLKI